MSKFAFVLAERGNHAVAALCRVVGVSVSGFYAWLRAIPTAQNRAKAEAELRGHIGRIFSAAGAFTARHGCMPSCTGRAGGTRGDASSG